MKQLTTEELSRFWLKVDKTSSPTGCWLWTAGKNKGGYGSIRLNGTMETAHRVSWFITNGSIPEEDQINHKCKQCRNCVNPDHLKLGNAKSNARDMVNDGTNFYPDNAGGNNGRAKLNERQVVRIKKHLKSGTAQKIIANLFNVSISNISSIKVGSSWGHLT